MAIKRDDVNWSELGREVEQHRLSLGWSKEEAAREAQVSAITWKRVEDGLRVQDGKLGAVLAAVGMGLYLPDGSGGVIRFGLAAVGGAAQDAVVETPTAKGYVSAPGPRVEGGDSADAVLQAIGEMRAEMELIKKKLDDLQQPDA